MNQNKVAFIICANNEQELSECVGYLDRLVLPTGFEKDVISVAEAPSMAAGYNAGMHSSDAKYKVYIHQDTFIINQNFVFDMLEVFADKEVGLMGVLGLRKMPRDSYAVSAWDTGKVYHGGNALWQGYQRADRKYVEVEAVDGLVLITQYDVEFREELFQQWDFYDISACYEFRRKGYKVVVPYQEECWIFHNNKASKMTNYDDNREIFAKEYSKDFEIDEQIEREPIQEFEKARIESIDFLMKRINEGRMKEVSEVLLTNKEFRYNCFKDIIILAEIYRNAKDMGIFRWTETAYELMAKLNALKYFLKRIEFNVDMDDVEYYYYTSNYPIEAFFHICIDYCRKRKMVMHKLNKYFENKKVALLLEERLPDENNLLNMLKHNESYYVYNYDCIADKKTVLVVEKEITGNILMNLSNILMKRNANEDCIIFSRSVGNWTDDLVSNGISTILCQAKSSANVAILNYFSKTDWNLEKVIFVGKGEFTNEVSRMLANTGIRQQTFAEYIEEEFADDARKYKYIADYLESTNPIQAELLLHPESKKTSIVVLSYNTLELTKGCIESIRDTLQPDEYELIVVDNASTDGSIEYLKQQTDIKLLCNRENKGFAGGCNQGIQMAEPENDIWLLNSDTLVPKSALLWLKMGLYADKNIGACGSVSNFSPNYQNTIETEVNAENYREVAAKYNRYMENALEKKNWLVGFSMLIKREALEKTGYLDEQFFPGNFEDNDLSYRLLQAGYQLMLCHNSFVFHYGSQSFKKANTVSKSLIENKRRFVNKWGFDSEVYTEIKSRQIAMIEEAPGKEFGVLDLNAGVGATLARLEYMYPRVFAAGMEDNAKVAEIARLNGHLIEDEFDRKFEYVLSDELSVADIEITQTYLKLHGKFIGRCYNRYYKELANDTNEKETYSGEEMLELLAQYGFEVKDISFVRGNYSDARRITHLCAKYGCAENLIVAEWFYFVASKINE